ncbi:MAG: hypothetical protein COV07_03005 [Candidatus Vogelbacteria bacterium CG10_big_fil_rev_8_21_14_0_10_45_14]|uniref:Uncharacterized protein n=1 Tax=Candidatus Vogelbacteria bacterium CG10_big_fil_rev_8_21_14_0_10_45_14 TaxID=1975042 RepID=A0A2H0RJE2_9BACT|nr:MAG: hypothetical protein COV07_03005 [Candidatus Vogelbacteria bacterium CG10_big_fil_rev_8_21_14_0_10_45_14]
MSKTKEIRVADSFTLHPNEESFMLERERNLYNNSKNKLESLVGIESFRKRDNGVLKDIVHTELESSPFQIEPNMLEDEEIIRSQQKALDRGITTDMSVVQAWF